MNTLKSTFSTITKRKDTLIYLLLSIAGLTLFGWLINSIQLTAFSSRFKPISPIIAMTFIALGILVLFDIKISKSRLTESVLTIFAIIFALFYSIIFLGYFFNFTINIENILVENIDRFGISFTGFMSPIASLLFIFSFISILTFRKRNSNTIRYIGGSLSLLVLFVSFVLLIGYLYNAPFLYGSTIIPVALPAAICFSLLSIILLSTFDYKFWTFNLIKGNKITIQLLKSFLPIVIILTIFSGFLNNAFSINHMNPPFISAVILLISVSITIYVVIVISTKVGSQLLMAEQSLKEIEKQLLKLNSDKDRFISILGHDLKSPFNNLLGLSELLTKNIHKYDIDKIENFATNIHESAQHSFNLLDNLLKWARAQQGNSPFKPQHLNLTDICKDALITLYPLAKTKNIVINCFTEDHLNVFADSDMLKTVLRNLVSNAIKYTNDGGTININAEEDSENVTISVSDNGIGIPPENLAKLFDISEVLTTKGTAKETGTGLGLMLCKEFVEKNGGKIWVESEAGKGSDFRFTMPIFTEQTININT